jgi:ssDNA-binding Zn-finger/Zn-ribbon topoisomerase 1
VVRSLLPLATETRQSRGAEGQIIGLTSDSPKGLCIGFPPIPMACDENPDIRSSAIGVCPICTTKAGFRSIRTTLFFHACYANPSLRGFLAYKPCLFVRRLHPRISALSDETVMALASVDHPLGPLIFFDGSSLVVGGVVVKKGNPSGQRRDKETDQPVACRRNTQSRVHFVARSSTKDAQLLRDGGLCLCGAERSLRPDQPAQRGFVK